MVKNRLIDREPVALYFGTTGAGSGHHVSVLKGLLSFHDERKIGDELDSDEELYAAMNKCEGIGYAQYRGVTLLGIPYSIHDKRGGSKTIFLINDELSQEEIERELLKYSFVYLIFSALKKERNLKGIVPLKI